MNRIFRAFLVFSFFFSLSSCSFQVPHQKLKAEIVGNGSILIEDGGGTVAIIEPSVFMPGWTENCYFAGDETKDFKELKGQLRLRNGIQVDLSGSVEPIGHGLRIQYDLVNSGPLTVQEVDASIKLNKSDWLGADCQVGLFPSEITSSFIPFFKTTQQCLVLLGPSKAHHGLHMSVEGDDSLAALVNESSKKDEPRFEFRLDTDKDKGFRWDTLEQDRRMLTWEVGEKKSVGFTIKFNRRVDLSPHVVPTDSFLKKRGGFVEGSPSSAPKVPMVTQTPVTAAGGFSGYRTPEDAKTVDYYLSTQFGTHLLVPAQFHINGKDYQGWLMWDTGVRPMACDINISEDFFKRLGFKVKSKRTAMSGLIAGSRGTSTSGQVDYHYIANDEISDAGPVNICLKIGELETENIRLYTDPFLDQGATNLHNKYDPFFKKERKGKVLGIVAWPFMMKYLISIDYKDRKIYFRPLNVEKRWFFDRKPSTVINCIIDEMGICCPVRLNNRNAGYGLFDTGAPEDLFDLSKLDILFHPFSNIKLGGYDVLKWEPDYRSIFFKKLSLYSKTKNLNLISLIGNDTFHGRFITIDPKHQKIYVEK